MTSNSENVHNFYVDLPQEPNTNTLFIYSFFSFSKSSALTTKSVDLLLLYIQQPCEQS